jgi:cell division protein FtsW
VSAFLSPRSHSSIIRWWYSLDRLSFFAIMGVCVLGVVMVATASPSVADRTGDLHSYHFLFRHLLFIGPAVGAIITISFFQVKWLVKLCALMFLYASIGVVVSLFFGMEIKGATRWIRLFGFSLQPSEFLKPAFIVLSAWLLGQQKINENFPGIILALGLFVTSAGLLILQPDFGMCFLLTMVFGMQIFLVGCPLRYIVILGGIFVVGITIAYFSLSHVQSRIDRFLSPESGDSYQIDKSKEAFMNGGLVGTGPGQGTVKNQVPDVHSDFIFTAMGEELGFLLTGLFVCGLAFLFYRLLSHFTRAESLFVMLAGSGLVFMLVVQSFIHMGSTLQLIPAKGMTLPLVSYGGSSLLAVGISFGLILALSRGLNENRPRGTWRHLTKKEKI